MYDFEGGLLPWGPPFTLGHENAGWVDTLGTGRVRGRDRRSGGGLRPVGVRDAATAALQGLENYCVHQSELGVAGGGLGADGGMAEYMVVPTRAHLVPLGDLDPVEAAPLTDAALTPYHAIKRSLPLLVPGSTAVVVGAGGLGHMAIQILDAPSPHSDHRGRPRRRRHWSSRASSAPTRRVLMDGDAARAGPDRDPRRRRRRGARLRRRRRHAALRRRRSPDRSGHLTLVGIGGGTLPLGFFTVPYELSVATTYWGSIPELFEVIALAQSGRSVPTSSGSRSTTRADAYERMRAGTLHGRAVVVPVMNLGRIMPDRPRRAARRRRVRPHPPAARRRRRPRCGSCTGTRRTGRATCGSSRPCPSTPRSVSRARPPTTVRTACSQRRSTATSSVSASTTSTDDAAIAEVAFMVEDDQQGHGLGTTLLESLVATCRRARHPTVPRLVPPAERPDARRVRPRRLRRRLGPRRRRRRRCRFRAGAHDDVDRRPRAPRRRRPGPLDRPAPSPALDRGRRRRARRPVHRPRHRDQSRRGRLRRAVHPVNAHPATIAGRPTRPDRPRRRRSGRPRGDRGARRARCSASRSSAPQKGVHGLVVISGGFAELDDGEAPATGARSRCAAERHAPRRTELRRHREHRPEHVRMNATFSPVAPVPGRVGCRVAVRRCRHRAARARARARPRRLDVRVDGQQGRRLRQRPHAVLGRRSADRRRAALPRVVRQPAQVRAHRPRAGASASRSSR